MNPGADLNLHSPLGREDSLLFWNGEIWGNNRVIPPVIQGEICRLSALCDYLGDYHPVEVTGCTEQVREVKAQIIEKFMKGLVFSFSARTTDSEGAFE